MVANLKIFKILMQVLKLEEMNFHCSKIVKEIKKLSISIIFLYDKDHDKYIKLATL